MSSNERMPDSIWRHMTQHQSLVGTSPAVMTQGEGCYLRNDQGRKILDGFSGLWCVNVGYGRQELADVAYEQMKKLSYLAPTMVSEPSVQLAAKIEQLLGTTMHVYYSCSGSEANETAFKIARQYHLQSGKSDGRRRYKIVSRYRGYHGATMGAMAATGQANRKLGYDPEPAGFIKVMPPYPYRDHQKLTLEEQGAEAARQLEETIIHEGYESVAAVIMEPVISGGGVIVPPDNYLPLVRQICDRYGVLLILDEVVSGFGRTGKMFGHDHWNTKADIYTFAKGLASGYQPIAATAVKQEIFDAFYGEPGDGREFRSVNTFGGSPISTAVALRNIQILEDENLVENAARQGDYFRAQVADRLSEHPFLGDIRGKGLLTGLELVGDKATREPLDQGKVTAVIAHALQEYGVIIGRNGNTVPGRENTLIIGPPLVSTETEMDRIAEAIAGGLETVLSIN
ncbi:aminotransferase [Marinobacter sediminicola]|uniref:aminotransferase n=1 Tax=Marinobacter sediminicola TaxID=3072994 RepID=UPI0028111944|nr:aminotransferase [Marinobacter sp. F26243]